jgi:hypothetical protein
MVVPYTKKISSCLAQALRIGNAGRFVDRRKMLAEDVNRVLAELQEKAFGHQKMALDSTLPPHVHHSRNHIGSKLCVAVEKQESVRLSVSPCFSQLLHNPESMGISRHIEMQDLTPVVADNEKAVQNTERERWDGEEGHARYIPFASHREPNPLFGDRSDEDRNVGWATSPLSPREVSGNS